MKIVFKGSHTAGEAAESVLSILKLFKDRYGIRNFRNLNLDLTLLDNQGQDVELVDASTSEILSVFEVYKSSTTEKTPKRIGHLTLVVDNTKKK